MRFKRWETASLDADDNSKARAFNMLFSIDAYNLFLPMIRSSSSEINDASTLSGGLGEFFAQGIEAADLPALFPLLRAREALNAFHHFIPWG